MRDHAMAQDVVDIQSESVFGSFSILQADLSLHLAVRLRLEQTLLDHANIPARKILWRHSQFARSEEPPSTLFRRWTQRAQGIAEVPGSVGLSQAILVDIHHRLHS